MIIIKTSLFVLWLLMFLCFVVQYSQNKEIEDLRNIVLEQQDILKQHIEDLISFDRGEYDYE